MLNDRFVLNGPVSLRQTDDLQTLLAFLIGDSGTGIRESILWFVSATRVCKARAKNLLAEKSSTWWQTWKRSKARKHLDCE